MTPASDVTIRDADLSDARQAAALVAMVDGYARGPEGQGAPLTEGARERLAGGLRAHPAAFVLMAFANDEPVGIAVCVWGFSTFAGRPSVNLHDLAVTPEHRGRGIGRALLRAVADRARERNACKVTLEVHASNARAKALYESEGFGPWDPPTLFVSKPL